MKKNIHLNAYVERELEPASVSPNERHWEQMTTLLDRRSKRIEQLRILKGVSLVMFLFLIIFGTWFIIPDSNITAQKNNAAEETPVFDEMNSDLGSMASTSSDIVRNGSPSTVKIHSSPSRASHIDNFNDAPRNDKGTTVLGPMDKGPAEINSGENPAHSQQGAQVTKKTSIAGVSPYEEKEMDSPSEMQSRHVRVNEAPVIEQGILLIGQKDGSGQIESQVGEDILPEEEEFGPAITRMQLILLGGPQFNQRQLTGYDNTSMNSLEENEVLKNTFDLGLHLSYRLSQNFSLQGGLGFYQIEEELRHPDYMDTVINVANNSYWDVFYLDKWIHTDSVQSNTIPERWIITDSVQVKDSNYVRDYDTSMQVNNENGLSGTRLLQYLEIPLLLSYEKSFSRVTIGLQGGVGISYMVYRTGAIAIENGRYVDAGKGGIYHAWGINALAGCFAEYRLFEHWSLGVNPQIRIPLTPSISYKNYRYKYGSVSVRLRVRYYF